MRFFRTLLGLLLIPAAAGTAGAFLSQISGIGLFSGTLRLFERGALVYAFLHLMVMRPVYLYVLGHELVHVLAAWLCGGRVVAFNVKPSGGNVVTSKTNPFIELSPYFVPLYTILLGPVFWVMRVTGYRPEYMPELFVFLVGLTLAFHFIMTSEVLRMEQPDVARSGLIFSFVLIFLGNLIVIAAVFSPIFDQITFTGFIKEAYASSTDLYIRIWEESVEFVNKNRFW